MRKLWGLYLGLLDNHPLVTKSLSTGFLMGTGDILAQKFEHKFKGTNGDEKGEFKLNYKRVITMSTVGVLYSGPMLHYWYKSLDVMIKGESKSVVIKKMLVDQLVFAPFAIGGFMTVMNFINNSGELKDLDNFPSSLFYAVKINWLLWPAAQIVNFSLVPPNLRVLYSSIISIFWSMFLSHISFDKDHTTRNHNKTKEIN
ncbi:hypothetical protein RB653_004531 [Dictyostelium firmibasis]|uniref:Uncharacterized protein n=1 Tax=Dictyostelium firmibasis TaxID=79012 RepID=A0AAN7U6G0_9MYCE